MRIFGWILFASAWILYSCAPTAQESPENTLEMCQDKVDNDANGKVDCDDSGCDLFCKSDTTADVVGAPLARYTNGIQPTSVNHSQLQRLYQGWLTRHYEEDLSLNQARVRFQQDPTFDMYGRAITEDHTVSEGIAYGMLIVVSMDADATRFIRLWNYYKAHEDYNGLMNWMTYKFEVDAAKPGGASDADLDVALALVLAQKKWGNSAGLDFLAESKTIVDAIQSTEIDSNLTLIPGDLWGQKLTVRNPGYASVGAMHVFANTWNAPQWNAIADSNYALIKRCQNPDNGVIPDWCDVTGSAPKDGNHAALRDFYLEAVRMPWRLALDFYWYANSSANEVASKFAVYLNNLYKGDLTNMGTGINWEGGPKSGEAVRSMYRGAYALLMSTDAAYQSQVDYLFQKLMESSNTGYYESSLQLLYAVTLAGYLPTPY